MAGLKRRLPRVSDVARFVGPTFRHGTTDRWSRVRTVADFKRLAQRRTPRSVFDYVEGAAELELSRDRAVAAFRQTVFHPHVLRDMSAVDTMTTILGRPAALPAVFGPTGFTRMMHAAGEPAVARAAGRAVFPTHCRLWVRRRRSDSPRRRRTPTAGFSCTPDYRELLAE